MKKTLLNYGIRAAQSSSLGQLLFDAPALVQTEKGKLTLERHFNDLYAVFLHKLTAFALRPDVSREETVRLRAFFEQLLKAHELLGE